MGKAVPKSLTVVAALLAFEVVLLAALYLRKSLLVAGDFGFPLDDSWIHATFARNIAEGRGLVYNLGQPVSPTTVLYTLALSLLYRIGVAPLVDAVALGVVLHVASSVLLFVTARQLGVGFFISSAAAALFAAVPRLVWGAIGGMEVPLYVFLTMLGIYFHTRYRWNDGLRAYLPTAAFGLATLARPECGVFLIASMADRFYTAWRVDPSAGELRAYARTVPLHILIFGLVIAPEILFNLRATGLPLPPPFYVKTGEADGGTLARLLAGVQAAPSFLYFAARACVRDNWLLSVAAAAGVVLCIGKRNMIARNGILILPIALFSVPVATSIFARTGDTGAQLVGQCGRYSGYLVPLFMLLAACGLEQVHRLLTARPGPLFRSAVPAVVLVACAVMAASNSNLCMIYAVQVQNINAMQVAIGKWAAKLPPRAVLAVNDAGAIPYFSRHTIIDTEGVVNPEVLPYRTGPGNARERVYGYLRERRPDYVIVFPNWYPEMANHPEVLTPVRQVKLQYNIICGGDTMVVYKARWNR